MNSGASRPGTRFYTLHYKVTKDDMKIIRAEHLGMCFGVRDAVALALKQAETEPLTILGDLVHNERVLAELRARGIRIARHAAEVETAAVMVTAHGASEQAMEPRAGARPVPDGSHLSPGARGPPGRRAPGPRRLPSRHHRPARPRRGARA